jgi:hypothetical protein
VVVEADNTIFLANSSDGLRAYTHDDTTFTETGHIGDRGSAQGVAVAPDGTIYLANSRNGLYAYIYDGMSFTNMAVIDEGGQAWGVAVDSDGTIFLANDGKGLFSYNYSSPVKVENQSSSIPAQYSLSQNYPNPFNPTTTIGYSLPCNGFVEIEIFDLLGRKVRTLVTGRHSAGNFHVSWDGLDNNGNIVSSGVYFYSMTSAGFAEKHKLLLLR